MKPWRIALGYIAFSVLALALFAVPLWYGWRANIGTFRTYVPEEMQQLVDLFQREGPAAVTAAVRANRKLPQDEVVLFAGPGKQVLAGTLRAWPPEVPDAPGTYGLVIGLGADSEVRIVASHVTLPGDYHLLMGRESVRFESLVERFWYGMVGALAVVLALGGALALMLARRTSAVRHSEERHTRAMRATKDGIWEWNPATDEVFLSERARELWAVPDGVPVRTRAELKRLGGFHPDDLQRTEDEIQATRARGAQGFDMEYRVIGASGEVRWVRSQGRLFPGAEGGPGVVTGSLTDVTERKRAEEALRQSEDRYARAMEGSDVGHWDWNIVSDEMFVSERAREMMALPAGALPARRAEIMALVPMHPDDRRAMADVVRIAIQSGIHERDYRVIPRPGEVRWLRSRAKVYKDTRGAAARMTGSLIDITERKRAEETLRRSEERYSLAIEASEEGYVDANVDTDEFVTSARLNEIFGIAPDARFKDRHDFLRQIRFYGDDGEIYHQTMRAVAVDGGPDRYQFEFRIVLPSGEMRWLRTRGKVTRDAEGRARRRVGVVADITARKLAEEGVRESQERYARAMEATEAGHWEWDLVSHQVFQSPRFRELYGVEPHETFADRDAWKARQPLSTAERERQEQALQAAIADPTKNYDIEISFELRPGVVRWLRSRGKVFRAPDGRPLRVTGATTDITAQKLAQEALRGSEERYALAMEAAGDGHTDWNLVTGEFYISPRMLRIVGHPRDATFTDRADWVRRFPFHPEDRPRWEAAIAEHFAGTEAKFRMDLRIVVNGETRWVAFTFIATRDPAGKVVRWTGSIADINDAKLAEAALRQSEDRHSRAMSAADSGFWDWHVTNDEFYVSPRLLEMTGFAPGTTFAGRADFMRRAPFHPDDREAYQRAVKALFAGDGSRIAMELRVIVEGETTWQRLAGMCFRDAEGKVVRWTGSATYVTERKRAEEALRESQERYALAVAGSDDGIWDIDFAAQRVFLSARSRELTGLPPGPEMVPLDEFMAMLPVHPDDVPQRIAAMQAHLTGQAPAYEGEFRMRQLDGVYRWRRVHGICVRDANGQPQRMAGSFSDVDARRRAEEALRLSEERYALALAASDEGHFDVDLESGEVFASARLNEIYGFARQATTANRFEYVNRIPFHPEDRHLAADIARADWEDPARLERLERYVVRIIPRPGETRWIQVHATVTRDAQGRPRRRVGVVADITERKLAEEARRLSEERYALAVAGASDGIWDEDYTTGLLYRSPRNQEIALGRPSDGIDVRPRSEWAQWHHVHPDDAPKRDAALRAHLEGRAPIYEIEYRVRHPDGIYHWIHARGVCIRDASGRALRIAGSTTNVDARKAAEEALSLSEERYALAMQASGEGHWDWKIATDEFYASPRYLEMAGFPPDMKYAGREDIVPFLPFHPDDKASYEAAVAAHFAGETPRVDIVVRLLPRGKLHWLHVIGFCTRDAAGKPLRWAGSVSDITERKLAAEALRLSEERYAYAMEAAQDAHWDWKIGTDEYYTSPRVVDVFGFPPGTSFTSRKDYLAKTNILEEDLQAWQRAAEALFAGTGSRLSMDLRAIVHGEVRWIQHNGVCLRDASGRPDRWCGTVRDVTERRRAENALRLSEERYALAMEASEEGHFDWDVQSDEIFASEHLKKMLDLPEDIQYRTRGDMVSRMAFYPGDRERVAQIGRETLASRALHSEFEYRLLRGETRELRWIRARWMIFRGADGAAQRVIGVVSDITARKQAVDTLRDSEARFRRMTELSADTYWEQDENFRYTRTGESADIAGYVPDVNQGKTRWGLSGEPTALSSTWEEHQAVLAAHQPFRDFEYRRRRPDGSIGYYSASGAPMFDGEGRFRGYQGVARNITERRRFLEALREQTERLQLGQAAMRMIIMDWNVAEDAITWSDSPEWLRGPMPAGGRYPSFKDQVHPEDRENFVATRNSALETLEVQTTEFRLARTDGEVIWVLERKQAFAGADGKAVRMLAAMFDITDRKRAEEALRRSDEALRQSEERYAVAAEGASQGIFDWDLENDRVFHSHRAQEFLGLEAGEPWRARREWAALIRYHPEDVPRIRESIRRSLHGEKPMCDDEFRVLSREGELRWLHQRGVVLRDASGKAYRMAGSIEDVTERKVAAQALRRSEALLLEGQRLAQMGNFSWRVRDGEISWSEQIYRIFEFEPGSPVTLERIATRVLPEELAMLQDMVKRALQGEDDFEYEHRVLLPDGRIKHVHLIGHRAGEQQDGLEYVGTVQDITGRKLAEEALRRSQHYLAEAQSLSHIGSFAFNADGFQFWSSELFKIHGLDPLGKAPSIPEYLALVHPEDRDAVAQEIEHMLATGEGFDFKKRIVRPDGTIRLVRCVGIRAPTGGNVQEFVGSGMDVTEQERAEDALRQSEERYALAVAGSNEGIFDWDLVSDRVYVSYRAQELFGLPRGELWRPRRDWRHILTFHPEDAPKLHDGIKAHIEGGTPTYDVEFRVIVPGGAVRWYRQRGIALRDASGKAYRVVGSIGDVTERKQAEQELRKMERELRRAQRLEGMGTLAGGIAHDFNNILGAILGYGEMALRDAKTGTRLRRDLDSIMAAGERGRSLIDRILAFSRSGLGERLPVHVEAVVREALDQVAAKLPESVTLAPRLRAGRAAMLGDSTQVHQVVMNLASNAVQAMPKGGVLRVALETAQFAAARMTTIGGIVPGDYLVLKVSDTGTGISQDVLERMFDPFFTTKEVGVGSGLGLSLVHGIVTSVGGAVDVATELGKGTTFTVYLRRSGDAPEKKAADEDRPLPRGEGQRVLVVDDEEPLVKLAARTLEELGYAPTGFTSSTAALAAFRADPAGFDAVLTDERMPGLTGSALIREMRGIRAAIPVVLMSGYLGIASVDADIVVRKPVSARDLAASLARVLHP